MTEGGLGLPLAVWDGAIPVCLTLHEQEVASQQAPPSLFVVAPRGAYLPLLSAAAAAHFADALPSVGESDVWFDAGGVPLKWHLPSGVLFDLLGSGQLPWRLNVHFRGFPEGLLLPCAGPDAVRGHLFNALKVLAHTSTSKGWLPAHIVCAPVRRSPPSLLVAAQQPS